MGREKLKRLCMHCAVCTAAACLLLAPSLWMLCRAKFGHGWLALLFLPIWWACTGGVAILRACGRMPRAARYLLWRGGEMYTLAGAAMLAMFLPVYLIMLVIMGGLSDMLLPLSILVGMTALWASCARVQRLARKDAEIQAYLCARAKAADKPDSKPDE